MAKEPKLKFYEKSHVYKLGKQKLTSVTTFLSDYFGKFDANAIAKFKAYKSKRDGEEGRGVKYWKAYWKSLSDQGTRIHKALEEFVEHQEFKTRFEPEDLHKINSGLSAIELIDGLGFTPEQIIYDAELGLAGTIDLLVKRKGGIVDLYDWKTNKAIVTEGYRGTKAKKPINHLQDCNYSKYALQLSTYAYMLEKQGHKIGTLNLIHLKEDGFFTYKIPYLKSEVESLLKNKKEKKDEEK